MASLTTIEKNPGKRSRSDSDAIAPSETVANPLRDYILESARTIHRTELTIALLRWTLSVVALFFSLVLIDQWLWPLNTVARYAVWVGFIGGTTLWFSLKVLPLIGRTIHPHYAARQIESTLPEIKEGLITWVQLSGSDSPPPKSVLNTVGRYVAKQLKGQDIASVIDQLNPLKLAAALMGLTLIGAIYLATSPKSVPATIQRLLMPWANVAPATRVQILSVTPGNATVIQGSNATIEIQVRGWQRQDRAMIRYSTDDGQTVDQKVAMASDIEGLSYRAELGKTFGGILQPIHYSIEAGDAVAGPFAIDVQAIPLSTVERIEYVYPEYMRLAPRTAENDGRIEGPEGTRIKIYAKGNQPMKSARVEFDSTVAKDGVFQPAWIRDLSVSDHSIEGDWILEVNEKRSNPTRYQYRIRSTNLLGESAPEPVVYPMIAVADMTPEVDFAAEVADKIEVAWNDSLDLEIRASDPDFGLAKLVLNGKQAGQQLAKTPWQEILLDDPLGVTGQVVRTFAIHPKQLGYQVNDVIELVLTASDNRHDPKSNKLSPNVVKSRVVSIKVIPPAKNPGSARQEDTPNPKENANPKDKNTQNKSNPSKTKPDNKKQNDATSKSVDNKSSKKSDPEKTSDNNSSNSDNKASPNSSNQKKSESKDSARNKEQNKESESSAKKNEQPSNGEKDQDKNSSEQNPKEQNSKEQNSKEKKSEEQKQPNAKGSQEQQQKQENSSQQKPSESRSKEKQGTSEKNPKSDDPSESQQGGGDDKGASDSSDQNGGAEQGNPKDARDKRNASSNQANSQPSDQSSGQAGASDAASEAGMKSDKSQSGKDNSGKKGADQKGADEENAAGENADGQESDGGQDSEGHNEVGKAPTHDGEAFERLQKIMNPAGEAGSWGSPSQEAGEPSDETSSTKGPAEKGSSSKGSNPSSSESESGRSADQANESKSGKGSSEQSVPQKGDSTAGDSTAGDSTKEDPTAKDSSAKDPSPKNSSAGSGEQGSSTKDSKPRGDEKTSNSNNTDSSGKGEGDQDKGSSPKSSQKESPLNESAAGESQAGDTNNQGSNTNKDEGNGKPGDSKAGEEKANGSQSNSSGSGSKGESNQSKSAQGNPSSSTSKGGVQPSQGGQPGEGKPNGSQAGNSQSANSPSGSPNTKGTQANGENGTGAKATGENAGQGERPSPEGTRSLGDQPTNNRNEETEYAKSATDLVLESLKRQRDQPDPDLLRKMGWTKDQMQSFVDRWTAARDVANSDPTKKKEYEDMLQSLGLVPQTGSNRTIRGSVDGLSGLREEGARTRPPESLRERFESFRKAVQQPASK